MNFKFEHPYQKLPRVLFHECKPRKPSNPSLALWNRDLAFELGVEVVDSNADHTIAMALSGASFPVGAEPISLAYAGHQFGHFTMLGDGRAHLLGSHRAPNDTLVDIQLKGSGSTKFSRGGDGQAALKPMLREYIMSEALNGLGIPTSRALAVCLTGDHIYRETLLPGAVLTRVAESHIRVGTFEYAATQTDYSTLRSLANYAINRHCPELLSSSNPYLALFDYVVQKQIDLVVNWMRVGFIHGVMNTDNTTISGETIDYGPCAMMDEYHPDTVFSSIDQNGRYAFGRQSKMIHWNLVRFAEALVPLIHNDQQYAIELVEELISSFTERFSSAYVAMYLKKLGCIGSHSDDQILISDLLDLMAKHHSDYTLTFRDLMKEVPSTNLFLTPEGVTWLNKWRKRLDITNQTYHRRLDLMGVNNPIVIPRNHWVEQALTEANSGDFDLCYEFVEAFRDAYSWKDEYRKFYNSPPQTDRIYQTFCGT